MAYKTLDGVLKIVFVVALINRATHLKKKGKILILCSDLKIEFLERKKAFKKSSLIQKKNPLLTHRLIRHERRALVW